MTAFGLRALIAAGQGTLLIFKLTGIAHFVGDMAVNRLTSVLAVNEITAAAAEVRIKQLRLVTL